MPSASIVTSVLVDLIVDWLLIGPMEGHPAVHVWGPSLT